MPSLISLILALVFAVIAVAAFGFDLKDPNPLIRDTCRKGLVFFGGCALVSLFWWPLAVGALIGLLLFRAFAKV